jgi:hypothetical protein
MSICVIYKKSLEWKRLNSHHLNGYKNDYAKRWKTSYPFIPWPLPMLLATSSLRMLSLKLPVLCLLDSLSSSFSWVLSSLRPAHIIRGFTAAISKSTGVSRGPLHMSINTALSQLPCWCNPSRQLSACGYEYVRRELCQNLCRSVAGVQQILTAPSIAT